MSNLAERVCKIFSEFEAGTMDLVFAIEEEFDIEIPDGDTEKLSSEFTIIQYLKARGVKE